MKNEKKAPTNAELHCLGKGFKALNITHQKDVLKTARGLLRIQKTRKTILADNNSYVDFSVKGKNG